MGGDADDSNDLAKWGIRKKVRRKMIGIRVPEPLAENWQAVVTQMADEYGVSKANAAAAAMVVAITHQDEWRKIIAKTR